MILIRRISHIGHCLLWNKKFVEKFDSNSAGISIWRGSVCLCPSREKVFKEFELSGATVIPEWYKVCKKGIPVFYPSKTWSYSCEWPKLIYKLAKIIKETMVLQLNMVLLCKRKVHAIIFKCENGSLNSTKCVLFSK